MATYILFPAILIGLVVFLLPSVFYKVLRASFKILGKDMDFKNPKHMNLKTVLLGIFIGMCMWLVIGFGVMISIKSVFPDFAWGHFFNITGAYSLSYAIGYFSFITPAGLGVREGTMVYLINGTISNAEKMFFVLATRVWMMLSEIIILFFIVILLLSKGEFKKLRDSNEKEYIGNKEIL
ncbi:hypothetical protein DRQ26_02260 [bacterium]|nr:MAG: hypothetical protein DRQ26_02260 [bacterium]